MAEPGESMFDNEKVKSKKGFLDWYFKINLLTRIFTALVLGSIMGLWVGPGIAWISPLGDLFVRVLKMIVMPVVICTLIVGTSSINPSKLGRIGGKALLFYTITSAFAVAIGLLFGIFFKPGEGLELSGADSAVSNVVATSSLIDTMLNIVPTNPFNAISSGMILPTIFASLLVGIALAVLRESEEDRVKQAAETVFSFFEGCSEIIFLIVKGILQYAPVGVFALIAVVFGKQGAAAFGPLFAVTITTYGALLFHLIFVYAAILTLFRLNFFQFIKKARSAVVMSFVTRSSSGSLPVSMAVAEDEMGVSRGVHSFTLPIGATINMDGTAIYQGVCAVFIGLAIGEPLDFNQQVTVIVTAVLASIGTAGIPGAGAIMLLMVLESVGLRVEPGSVVAAAYAMIFGVDALLDMGRTSLNVTGDLTATCVISKSEDQLDESYWGRDSSKAKTPE